MLGFAAQPANKLRLRLRLNPPSKKSETTAKSLDSVVTWMNAREHDMMQRMSYLHPVSALPIIYYIAMKVQEVADLRLIVRGRLAGLSAAVLEAHLL